MRRVLFLLPLIAGCAAPERYQAYDSGFQTSEMREAELQGNLREGVSWEEQERRIAEAKAIFGASANGDASGPMTKRIPGGN